LILAWLTSHGHIVSTELGYGHGVDVYLG